MLNCIKKNWTNLISLFGLVFTIIFIIYCYQNSIFTSQESITRFMNAFGIGAPIIFIAIQALQVVVPIIPAGITCGFAVIFWGAVGGFILNYIGICIGSIIAFLLARKYGKKFVINIIGEDRFNRYEKKFAGDKFDKIFALLIFLPLAPDDFLCFFAGLTKIKIKKFVIIILLGKILGIIFYSMFIVKIFELIGLA